MRRSDSFSTYWGAIAFRIRLRDASAHSLVIFRRHDLRLPGDLALENLQYMMRYLNTDSPEYTGKYRTIYFNQSDKLQVGSYKGEVAVADEKSVTLYNMLGNSTLTYSINMQTPMLLTSDRYMLVYGLGENTFTVQTPSQNLQRNARISYLGRFDIRRYVCHRVKHHGIRSAVTI